MKLLRVLQTGEFERLGSNATRKADVRLDQRHQRRPAAARSRQGTFREDLYFRLNVIELPCRRCAIAPTTSCRSPSTS